MATDQTDAGARAMPSHIILLADHGDQLAGRVLKADLDLLARLDVEHAAYRTATANEIAVGAFGG